VRIGYSRETARQASVILEYDNRSLFFSAQVETVLSVFVTHSPNISFIYPVILDMHLQGKSRDHTHAMKSKGRGGLTPLIPTPGIRWT